MGSQSSMLERPEGYEGSDRSSSRSRSASPLPREDHILNRFDSGGTVDPEDEMDGLPRSYSTIPNVPRAQAESPEDRPRYATQPEPPGRTKKKKKKSKKNAMQETELEVEELEDRDTYREQAPSAEPIARARGERNDDVHQEPSSRKKRDKRQSKTPRHQPELPLLEEEEATQPFSADFHSLSLSSQQAPNRTQLEDLQEGLVDLPLMRASDAGSSRKKKRKDKGKSLEQAREATSELAADPISDNEETGEIPSSVRSFKKREPGISNATSHKKPRIPPPPESIEDFDTYRSQARSLSPAQIIEDSQKDDPIAPRGSEPDSDSPNDKVKADREEETESILEDQSPALACQQRQRRGRVRAAQRLVVELGNKSVGRAVDYKAVPADVDNETDAQEPLQMGSEMDVDNDLGGDNTLQATEGRDQEQGPEMSVGFGQGPDGSEDESMQDVINERETDPSGSGGREASPPGLETEEIDQSNRGDDKFHESSQGPVNGVAGLDDSQIPSPPPTEDGPQPVTETARAKTRTGRPKKSRNVYDLETQQTQENGGPSALAESLPVISTPPASSAKTPRSQRGTKRKPKTPYFEREEDENVEAFAELPPDDAVASPKVKPPLSSDPSGEGASTTAPRAKPKPKRSTKATPAKKATPANDSDSDDAKEDKPKPNYRSGMFTDAEQTRIRAAVEAFREYEDLSQQEINTIIQENPKGLGKDSIHQRLWQAVVESCPSRSKQRLINWCRERFHNFVARATWTKEQDDELMQMVRRHGTKWSLIGGLINRHQKDVRDRHRNYLVYRGKATNFNTWSAEEEDRFYEAIERAVESIRDAMVMDDVQNKGVEELINWHLVSEAMGFSRTRLQCLSKWKRLCATDSIPNRITTKLPSGTSWRLVRARKDLRHMTAEDKYTLVCEIRDSEPKAEYQIPWRHIVTDVFEGKYERQALVVIWGRLRESVPGWQDQTIVESAAHIAEMYEQDHGFLTDDRTTASRSREPTAEAKTPSRRSEAKRKPTTPSAPVRSNALIDPDDDESDGVGEEGSLPNLSILRNTRRRGRGVSEEVEESVLGDAEERANGDVEMADGDEAAAETQGEEDTQPTNAAPRDHDREESVDLSFGAEDDAADKTPRAARDMDVDAPRPMSPSTTKKSKQSKTKGKKIERRNTIPAREPSEERAPAAPGSPTPTNTPLATANSAKKRRAVHPATDLPNGTNQTPTISTPDTGESPTKRRRRNLNLKTYSSVRAREQKSKILGTITGRRKSGGSDIENDSGDEELEASRVSSARKRLSAAGSPSLTQSQPAPPSAQPEPETYSDLSSNMDDMEDIPAELPEGSRFRGTPLRTGFS